MPQSSQRINVDIWLLPRIIIYLYYSNESVTMKGFQNILTKFQERSGRSIIILLKYQS